MADLIRVTFSGAMLRDVGDGQPRPVSVYEVQAEWLALSLRGHIGPVQVTGPVDPRMIEHLPKMLSRPGRPGKHTEHFRWATVFRKIYAEQCAQHELYHVDGDQPPSRLEVAQLVVEELGLDVSARAVWKAVKPHI